MATQEIGFQIQGRFYPWVGFDDWKHKEIKAVRAVTGYNPRALLIGGEASAAEVNLGFATVAFWRLHAEIDEHDLVRFFDELRPADIEPRGFERLREGTDASPPDEAPGNNDSGNTEPSSESTQAKSNRKRSGSQPSAIASASGPREPSEN
jgi:hypothetical protein